jgi:hypothetical protein
MDPNKSVEDEEKKEAKGSPGSGVRQRRKAGTPESDSSGSESSKSRPKFVLPKKTIIVIRQTSKVNFNFFCTYRIKFLKQLCYVFTFLNKVKVFIKLKSHYLEEFGLIFSLTF